MNGVQYLQLLTDGILPAIQQTAETDFDDVWFQQVEAPAYYALIVRDDLNHVFFLLVDRDSPSCLSWPEPWTLL